MLRFLLPLVVAFAASVGPAVAGDNSPVAAAACQSLVESALLGHSQNPRNVEVCNANEHCAAAKRFIAQRHRTAIPGLTCAGASTAKSPEEVEWLYPIFENACALATAAIMTGVVVGNFQEEVALCNQHPDKRSCQSTMAFIKENHNGDTGGVTCQYQ
jgi:hypothetical protein